MNDHERALSRSATTRRTLLQGAAWSVPAIALAAAVPSHAASVTFVIAPGTAPSPAASCNAAGDFTFTVTNNGVPVASQSVVVTLPTGFSWPGAAANPQTFVTGADGVVTVSGVLVGSTPGLFTVSALLSATGEVVAMPVTVTGTWIGHKEGYAGSGVYPIYYNPTDVDSLPATPDNWAYCIENQVTARTGTVGHIAAASTFLGSNYYGTAVAQAKIQWIIAHAYPNVSLDDFRTASGIATIAANDAIEAAQYAVWNYSEYASGVVNWPWENADSEAAYWYLINGAETSGGSAGPQSIVNVPTSNCGTPTSGSHAQTLVLMNAV